MSKQTEQPEPAEEQKYKRVSVKHRDLHAAAEVYDVLDSLDEPERRRVIEWVNWKYPPPDGEVVS